MHFSKDCAIYSLHMKRPRTNNKIPFFPVLFYYPSYSITSYSITLATQSSRVHMQLIKGKEDTFLSTATILFLYLFSFVPPTHSVACIRKGLLAK